MNEKEFEEGQDLDKPYETEKDSQEQMAGIALAAIVGLGLLAGFSHLIAQWLLK